MKFASATRRKIMRIEAKKLHLSIRLTAGFCYILLLCLSLWFGKEHQNLYPGPIVLRWKYAEILKDNLPKDWEWVKEKAVETGADDEGAWAYVANVCGNNKPEVILNYLLDGIIFVNSENMEIYSADRVLLLETKGYFTGLGFGLLKVNGALPIYGFGLYPIVTSYTYKNGKYVKWLPGLPLAWSWLLAAVFLWAVSMPPEIGLLFVGMQIMFCWLLSLIERRFIVNPLRPAYKPFLKKIVVLLGVETLVAIPSSVVPLFFMAAPIIGIILLMKILQPPKEVMISKI